MESLAVVIMVLFVIAIFAGPIAIGLSAKFLTNAIDSKTESVFRIIDFLRQAILLLLVSTGVLVGSQFLFIDGMPIFPRVIGVFAIVTSYIALRREYFPRKFFIAEFLGKLGIRRKNGHSSGSDGFGPSGQH